MWSISPSLWWSEARGTGVSATSVRGSAQTIEVVILHGSARRGERKVAELRAAVGCVCDWSCFAVRGAWWCAAVGINLLFCCRRVRDESGVLLLLQSGVLLLLLCVTTITPVLYSEAQENKKL